MSLSRQSGRSAKQPAPRTRATGRGRAETLVPAGAVPSIVYDVLREPGQPLDAASRAYFEPRFGADFGAVRVHTGPKAVLSAAALGADAYTHRHQIVFGSHPLASRDRRLLAHELAHVRQTGVDGENAPSRIGRPDATAESEAHEMSRAVLSPTAPTRRPHAGGGEYDPGTIRRSIVGSILGGIGGTLAGGIAGAFIGGPIGAIVGAVAGAAAGTALVNQATTRERRLDPGTEIPYAKEVFADSIDYSVITITRDSVLSIGAPKTLGNTIHLRSDWGHFKGDGLELTDNGLLTLIHEMGHVWQYQNRGLDYIPKSLIAQVSAFMSGGDRGGAYNWESQDAAGVPWERWNPEQQAEAIEDYNKALRRVKDGTAIVPDDYHQLSVLLPYIEKVRHKEGAA